MKFTGIKSSQTGVFIPQIPFANFWQIVVNSWGAGTTDGSETLKLKSGSVGRQFLSFMLRVLQGAIAPFACNQTPPPWRCLRNGFATSTGVFSPALKNPPRLENLITTQDASEAREWVAQFKAQQVPKNLVELSFSRSSGPGGQVSR